MNNSEICVICGNTLPSEGEYGMVCYDCQVDIANKEKYICDLSDYFVGVKLKWYQRVLLRLLKIPRKGLHR